MQSFQEDLQENGLNGVNPNQTSSPTDAQIGYCAKLWDEFDADAKAESKLKFTWEPYHLHLLIWQLEEIIREKRAILDSIGYYKPVKMWAIWTDQ